MGRDPSNPDQIDALASSLWGSEIYFRDTKTYLATLLIVNVYHKALKFSTVLNGLPKARSPNGELSLSEEAEPCGLVREDGCSDK